MKSFSLKITSAVALEGQLKPAGSEVTVDEYVARDLLRRGKAVLDAQEQPGDGDDEAAALAEQDEAAHAADADQDSEPEAEAATPATKKAARKAGK